MREDEPSLPTTERTRAWQHPTVIVAVIGGLFGLLTIVFQHFFSDASKTPEPPPTTVTASPVQTTFDFTTPPMSARLVNIQRALGKGSGNQPDVQTRRQAITALVAISGEQPPDAFYAQAMKMLSQYVKDNIDERRASGEQVERDVRPSGTLYRPLDIVAAIEGMQAVRRASGERVPAALDGVDFRGMNLEKLDLEGYSFTHANFSDASLSDCHCRGADFRHARFHGTAIWGTGRTPADFREANFDQADLAASKWANVDFSGSTLEKANGLKQVAIREDLRGVDTHIFD